MQDTTTGEKMDVSTSVWLSCIATYSRCRYLSATIAAIVVLVHVAQWCPAQQSDQSRFTADEYRTDIRPLLARYCYDCHSEAVSEADVNLASFTTLDAVRRQTDVWVKVREMLDSSQMPPKDAPQPTDEQHALLQSWVRGFLTQQAKSRAGDPGPVVLRRLSNAEYTYTIRDLTGVASLSPTKEFPVDGAAGEGFTNVGAGQGMSPALVQKYLDAAKEVACHAVLTPRGIRFSPHTTPRDQSNELLAKIQAFYRRFTADGGGSQVNLQGIKFDTNQGGLLPLEEYLRATLAERDALRNGRKSIEQIALERSLSAKYLGRLWKSLSSEHETSFILEQVRKHWRRASIEEAPALAADIKARQDALWKFNSIGHIGRVGGPTSWLEAQSPITAKHEIRWKLPEAPDGSDVVLYLSATKLAPCGEKSMVVWKRPRIELAADGSQETPPPILLRDIRSLSGRVAAVMKSELARTEEFLDALVTLRSQDATTKATEELASERGLNPPLLARWAALAKSAGQRHRELSGHLTETLRKVHGYEAVNGWGSPGLPNLLANRSDQPVSFSTLTVPAKGVTVHPTPTEEAIIAWRSPIDGAIRIKGLVADADDKCGNGAAWRLEWRSEAGIGVLANGEIDSGRDRRIQLDEPLVIRAGDVVALAIGARDNNHVCDTTQVDLVLSEIDGRRMWPLTADVAGTILEGNPHADAYGNEETWHFCRSAGKAQSVSPIPEDSAFARWLTAVSSNRDRQEVDRLAKDVQDVLTAADASSLPEADRKLRNYLLDWHGPLRWNEAAATAKSGANSGSDYGLAPSQFDESANLALMAPQVLRVTLSAELVEGGEFVADGVMHEASQNGDCVQLRVSNEKPAELEYAPDIPILVGAADHARRRAENAMADFRSLFPAALCYARIVPVDEVVTLTLFHREDEQLQRLMLDDQQAAELDRLWDELYYVSREPIALTVAFEQISEFATQDRPDLVKAFAPLEKPINERADRFRQRLLDTQPKHLGAMLEFADKAWRRPLTKDEKTDLRSLWQDLRESEISHEQAVRLTLARVLTSPAFLYKLEQPASGAAPAPVSPNELAARLSYFLWSSVPDKRLRAAAQSGMLLTDAELLDQTRRMLKDERVRRLAIHFACQWLHLRDFDKNDDKNESRYPEFAELRDDMYEETVLFFESMFRSDGSILDILNADHTFLNESLAAHYGVEGVRGGHWRRVRDIQSKGRGGVLGMATFLASQSGASRTSPILRGNWVYETLLGKRLPRPPANVPQLPDSPPAGLTERQLIERHSSAAECAKCHRRIDPFGFALERFDAIGRLRGDNVDVKTTLPDGESIAGIEGLRGYLLNRRHDEIVRQFCRKLLGFAIGRELQLSDEPLLDAMTRKLGENEYRFSVAVEAIVLSSQFRNIRGRRQ